MHVLEQGQNTRRLGANTLFTPTPINLRKSVDLPVALLVVRPEECKVVRPVVHQGQEGNQVARQEEAHWKADQRARLR